MDKVATSSELRRHLGRILQQVLLDSDCIVVARYGQPVAALVPLELYRQLEKTSQPPQDKRL